METNDVFGVEPPIQRLSGITVYPCCPGCMWSQFIRVMSHRHMSSLARWKTSRSTDYQQPPATICSLMPPLFYYSAPSNHNRLTATRFICRAKKAPSAIWYDPGQLHRRAIVIKSRETDSRATAATGAFHQACYRIDTAAVKALWLRDATQLIDITIANE